VDQHVGPGRGCLLELVEMLKPGDELRRRLLDTMLQELVNAEAAAHIGAASHERSDSRTTQRNGILDKLVTTGVRPSRSRPEDFRTGSFLAAAGGSSGGAAGNHSAGARPPQ
jgi:putative transposase